MSNLHPKPSAADHKAIVLFGLSEDGKPQAGLFSEKQAGLAKKAAKKLGLTALSISSPELAALAVKIPAGRLYHNRRSFIPNARRDLHDKLTRFAQAANRNRPDAPVTAPNGAAPPAAGIPNDWDSIAPGHQVIAYSAADEGWWEAIVVQRVGDMLTLRWRDYPEDPQITAYYESVALQKPQATA
jgi:hypothetical protein